MWGSIHTDVVSPTIDFGEDKVFIPGRGSLDPCGPRLSVAFSIPTLPRKALGQIILAVQPRCDSQFDVNFRRCAVLLF